MRHLRLVLLLVSLLTTIVAGAFWVLTQVLPDALHTIIAGTFQVSDITLAYQIITAVFVVASIILALIVAIILYDRLQTFHAEIIEKDRFLLGETIRFKARFKGKLKNGFFTCKVPLPDGKPAFWPAFDTFQRTEESEVGILSGRTIHKAEWSYTIPSDFPTGRYLVKIGVWDRKDPGSDNAPVKEKSATLWVLSPADQGTFGTSTVISASSSEVATTEGRPKLVITKADIPQDRVKKLVVRFPHGRKREYEVRFYYVKACVDGGKTADDIIAYCGANRMRFVPSTQKSTFGVDFVGSETLEEFDKFGIESYVVALLRDDEKVTDEIKYIHPGMQGVSFVLFFTLKGFDGVYVPARTRVPYNIYGGRYGNRVIGHQKGIIKLHVMLGARDMDECTATFEIDFRNWKTFTVRQLDSDE